MYNNNKSFQLNTFISILIILINSIQSTSSSIFRPQIHVYHSIETDSNIINFDICLQLKSIKMYQNLNAKLTVGENPKQNIQTWCIVYVKPGHHESNICPWQCHVLSVFQPQQQESQKETQKARLDVAIQFIDTRGRKVNSFLGTSSLSSHPIKRQMRQQIQLYTSFFITKEDGDSKEYQLEVTKTETLRNAAKRFCANNKMDSRWIKDIETNLIHSLIAKEKRRRDIMKTSHQYTHLVIGASQAEVASPEKAGYSSKWLLLTANDLDILDAIQWEEFFRKEQLHVIVAEHVWEHLTYSEGRDAALFCYKYLKPGGVFRLAVPDAYWNIHNAIEMRNRNINDMDWRHRINYNYITMTNLLKTSLFDEILLLEYHTRNGLLYTRRWNPLQGFVQRTINFDVRGGVSLLVDAYKKNDEKGSSFRGTTKFTLASSNNKKVVSVSVLELLKRAKIAYQNQQLEQVKLLLDQGLQLDPFHFELLQLASQVTKNKGIEAIVKMREKIVEKK